MNKIGIGELGRPAFKKDGRVVVAKVGCTDGLEENILKAVNLAGGFGRICESGDEILLKPNFNTADAPPASSDPEFIKAIVKLLFKHGASKVVIGESSMMSLSTRKVMEETGMLARAKEAGAEVMCFDEGEWVRTDTGGKYLKRVSLPKSASGSKKLIHACCMKTHKWAKFTMSLKSSVGFMKPSERIMLHTRHLEEKVADLNLVVHPDLVIVDGRKCFISGGPACGELRNPNVVLASGDRIAIDAEAVKIIGSYEGSSLSADPWVYTQIRRAVELGLGVKNEQDYTVISA
ncbi:DUF362 domain-containing protein [Candidatus Bathyarchaeota archaeon]|nr:DUF362 domain-containing protein [Candidatus Bathyarchaeota archaeon]